MAKRAPLPLPRSRIDALSALILVLLLGFATAERLVNLDAFTGKFDEGIRAEQLYLMSRGFRPVRDIYAAQGPLSLDIFYGPYVLFGQTLAAARGAAVLFSLLGIAAVAWVGWLVGGRLGAGLAAAVLVASPLFLKNSRLALLEVPAMLPATLAVGLALLFQRDGRRRWLVLSAVCFALALLIKPMVIAAAVPIGLLLLLRPGRRLADFIVFGLVCAGVGGLVVLAYGPAQVWEQVIGYRGAAREAADWSLRENWSILREELRDEQLPIYVLAIAGGVWVALVRPRAGLALASWPLASLALLLSYSPLQFKHVAILFPPIALLVGTSLAALLEECWRSRSVAGPDRAEGAALTGARPSPGRCLRTPGVVLPLLVGTGLVGWYLTALPAVARQHGLVTSATTENRVESYAEETALIPRLTGSDEFIVVDEPIVAYDSRRMVPPGLVDTSHYRIRSGALSGAEVVAAAERLDVRLLLLFSDGLRELEAFERLVDERYRAVRIWERQNNKDRALYLRDDADFETARPLIAAAADRPLRAEFGGQMRLLGYNLSRDELRPGSSATLTLHWEGLGRMSSDYSVITRIVGGPAQQEAQTQRGLGGGGEGTSSWEPGRWVVRSQSLTVPARAQPGDYQLYVALYDSRARTSPPVTAGGEAGATEVLLDRLRVR